jgi:hypothetical protein
MSSTVINPENGRRKVRWVIAHFPVELFIRTAKAFVNELEKLCPNQFEIEILTLGAYTDKYGDLYTEEEMKTWKQTTPTIAGLENTWRTIDRKDIKETETFADIRERWEVFFEGMKKGRFEYRWWTSRS